MSLRLLNAERPSEWEALFLDALYEIAFVCRLRVGAYANFFVQQVQWGTHDLSPEATPD